MYLINGSNKDVQPFCLNAGDDDVVTTVDAPSEHPPAQAPAPASHITTTFGKREDKKAERESLRMRDEGMMKLMKGVARFI
uniref:Uncharacterized protein n=1 Tax=Tanacetum cinerariifolium TaxID=118510 RepID=A0A699JG48_TANCI|nr:hypothetical protein [Tanacetum cinerariifolium]